jgi:DNA-binding transcriptional LysR family regulator
MDHLLPKQALEAAGRAYRLAYASSSLSGLVGMARSGQAVIVLTRTAVPDDLQILTRNTACPTCRASASRSRSTARNRRR